MSMGGYFAPRAAAFEERIDGVVAYDTVEKLKRLLHKIGASLPRRPPAFVSAIRCLAAALGP